MDKLNSIAKENFNIEYIFPFQRLVISNILKASGYYGEDAKAETIPRQLILLPTGAGKSLCFMLPALMIKGLTLIIFPLNSLMADQARRIREGGATPLVLNGSTQNSLWLSAKDDIKSKGIKFLLTNPETLKTERCIKLLKELTISHCVIDESHTVSEWGESFRPAYLELGEILNCLSLQVISAFTATASKRIITTIRNYLFLNSKINIIKGNPDRENIYYRSIPTLCKIETLISLIRDVNYPTIVFHSSRVSCEVVSRYLSYRLKRKDILCYHAGLDRSSKENIEKWFFKSKTGVLHATCAYGMGIDKSDIRLVIHYDTPLTVEAYLQESGRGGRDRNLATAILLKDYTLKENNPICRRVELIKELDYDIENCSGCDVCDGSIITTPQGMKQIINFYIKSPYKFRLKRSAEILYGLYTHPYDTYGFGILGSWDLDSIKEAIEKLIELKLLKVSRSLLNKGAIGIIKEALSREKENS